MIREACLGVSEASGCSGSSVGWRHGVHSLAL